MKRGQEVVLNESLNVVLARGPEVQGEVVIFKELLEDGTRALIVGRADEERVCELGDDLLGVRLRSGEHVLMDSRSGLLVERIPRPEVEELVLEEVPDITYADVGGLDDQIEQIHDAVELPYLYADLFHELDLQPPKGILLYGPPGCGKTLIAKAVANSLASARGREDRQPEDALVLPEHQGTGAAQQVRRRDRAPDPTDLRAGAGEVRGGRARHRVLRRDGLAVPHPRHRASRSDIESTIVPQLLAEIDGVETLKNVIVIGASNREDLIDPAILRPGRLDVKIKIERPDEESSEADLRPVPGADAADRRGRDEAARRRRRGHGHGDDRRRGRPRCTRPTSRTGSSRSRTRTATRRSCTSRTSRPGAMIENIVRRSKKLAIKRKIAGGIARDLRPRTCSTRSSRSTASTRTCRTRRTRTTGRRSRARRASASSSCARCSPKGDEESAVAVRSSASPPVSTSSRLIRTPCKTRLTRRSDG